jgi:hypothetical protein
MSLFKPSHLSPNFEEVVYNHPLVISFQVNTNGSMVTAYKLEILHEYSDLNDPNQDIIGVVYGKFTTPLHNKDTATIVLTLDELKANNVILEANRNYKWRVRLYGEEDFNEYIIPSNAGLHWTLDENTVCRKDFIDPFRDITINFVNAGEPVEPEEYYLIVAQQSLAEYLPYWDSHFFSTIQDAQQWLQNYVPSTRFYHPEDLQPITVSNGLCPTMFFYVVSMRETVNEDYPLGRCYIDVPYSTEFDFNVDWMMPGYNIQYYSLGQSTQQNMTYVGTGMLVGSTKQIMWTKDDSGHLKRNSYARIGWTPTVGSFTPFVKQFDLFLDTIEFELEIKGGRSFIRIQKQKLNKEYISQLANGNFYMGFVELVSDLYLDDNTLNTSQLIPIVSVTQEQVNGIDMLMLSTIAELESALSIYATQSYMTLCYVQQEKIIQVDKNIGHQSLNKITFEKPFDYNPVHGTIMQCGLVSADFDYDRVYITPVEEFDNSDSFAYIHIIPQDHALLADTITESSVLNNHSLHKIINYVSSTGEVTLFNQLDYIPTIQYVYQIFKRDASDNTKYNRVAGSSGADLWYLGGLSQDTVDIYSNHSEIGSNMEGIDYMFDYLFVQPNYAIKNDVIHPMHLEIYNTQYKEKMYLIDKYDMQGKSVEVIDYLDNSMWLVYAKNMASASSELGFSTDLLFAGAPTGLALPQTAYKIYTNFVDSTPEGYFYCRYNKHIGFDVCNLNNVEDKVYIEGNNLHDNAIDFRDLFIKCSCQDIDEQGTLLGVNNVPIKEYRYEIMSADNEVIYDSGEMYDGKLECQFRGCINDTAYYIKIYIEDNYGKLFTSRIKIHVNYIEVIDKNNITITSVCEKQAIHLDFSPIKQFQANGNIVGTTGVAVQIGEGGLTFDRIEDHTLNTVELPNTFSFIFTFSLNANIVLDQNIHLINQVVTDETTNSLQDTYSIYLDTRPYLLNNGVYSINERYMQLLAFKNDTYDTDNPCCVYDLLTNEFKQTLQFAYILQKDSAVPHNNYIYIAPSNIQEVSESDRAMFMNTIPSSCIDEAGVLTMFRDDGSTTEDDVFLISDVLNNGDYFINKYQMYLSNMSRINCVIKNISDNETPNVSFTIGEAL